MIIAVTNIFAIILLVWLRLRFSVSATLGALWLTSIWALTFFSHLSRDFIQNDELFFASAEFEGLVANRSLWILINQIVSLTTDDVVIHMRVLNLSFVLLTYAIALKTFKSFGAFTLALFLSYFACIAALNVRDPLILLAFMWFLRTYGATSGGIGENFAMMRQTVAPSVLLFLLRPLQLGLLYLSGFRWYYGALLIVIFMAILQSPIGERFFYNYAWHFQNLEQSLTLRAEDKDIEDPRPTVGNIATWSVRFLMAPLPWTSVTRVFEDDDYEYGKVDLTVRAFHRLLYYGLLLAIVVYWLRRPKATNRVLRSLGHIIKFCLLFSIVYAIFNFGGSHERIKLTIFVGLLFLVDRIRMELDWLRKECRQTRSPI